MSDYDYDSVTNNLRDSANGTFVTLDDFPQLTPGEGRGIRGIVVSDVFRRLVARARLVVLAGEFGRRFFAETAQFISSLAWVKTQGMSDLLRLRASPACTRRWSALLSCSPARVFASSLLDGRASGGVDGETNHARGVGRPQTPWVKRGASFSSLHRLTSLYSIFLEKKP